MDEIWVFSTGAILAGFILDLLFGDPSRMPHIVRLAGGLIVALEKRLRPLFPASPRGELAGGSVLAGIVALLCTGLPFLLLLAGYGLWPPLGFLLESALCYQLLAMRSLRRESMKVRHYLRADDLAGARRQVATIVGRDAAGLDRDGIARAAVETVAENTSDGVVAPLFYLMLGGAALGCFYKAVNTMDSMIAYRNERYLYFGRAAARLDDLLNYLPSRLCALLMIAAASLSGHDGKNAARIWRRDRRRHASPNSAQTESVCAGALGIRLGGP
ncbi:MAG: adenosylcobinamide-phosphate synthase CbiB, partial [Azoarcus sp.]|nr:adenosylcobinamide-phosphate synthase CbiB [Azoarcus sp.]